MTITHISERELALERENAKMLQTIRVQAAAIEAQRECIAELEAELEALKAQPVQEPVLWVTPDGDRFWKRAVQPSPLTDAQASKVARLVANRNAELCNVDPCDNWKIYGQDFIDEVRFFEAAIKGGAT